MIVALDRNEPSPEEVGGKAAGLARLFALGLPVPPAVAIPVSDGGAIDDPEGLLEPLGEPLAVRSSAVGEDAVDRSAAGQFESVMGVRLDGLADAVRRVIASAHTQRAAAYRGRDDTRMAVVVQREVEATRAGVAFSRDPLTHSDDVVIECVFGHGERLVSGAVDPDRYAVAGDGTVRARVAPREGSRRLVRTLRDDEAGAVAGLTRRAEEGLGLPVDVEFCFDPAGVLWLVQCRAITTLGEAAAP